MHLIKANTKSTHTHTHTHGINDVKAVIRLMTTCGIGRTIYQVIAAWQNVIETTESLVRMDQVPAMVMAVLVMLGQVPVG